MTDINLASKFAKKSFSRAPFRQKCDKGSVARWGDYLLQYLGIYNNGKLPNSIFLEKVWSIFCQILNKPSWT